MPPKRRSGKGVKDQLVKASEVIKKVAETKLLSDILKATGNPVAGKIVDNLGAGKKKKRTTRKGKGLFDFLGMGKKKAPARRGAGWGSFLKGIVKAPIQVLAPALGGAIMGTSGGLQGGIDSVGNGRRRPRHGGMKMVPAVYTPASQLTR